MILFKQIKVIVIGLLPGKGCDITLSFCVGSLTKNRNNRINLSTLWYGLIMVDLAPSLGDLLGETLKELRADREVFIRIACTLPTDRPATRLHANIVSTRAHD